MSIDPSELTPYTRRALELRAAEYYASICKPESEWHSSDDLAPQLEEFEHYIQAGDCDHACSELETINKPLIFWGHYDMLLRMRQRLQVCQVSLPHLRLANINGLGYAYYVLGDLEMAITLYEHALTLAKEFGYVEKEGTIMVNLGRAHSDLGRYSYAIALYGQAIQIAQELGTPQKYSVWLGDLASAYRDLGNLQLASEYYTEALAMAQDSGELSSQARLLGDLGYIYYYLSRTDEAIQCFTEALSLARELGYRWEEGNSLYGLGITHQYDAQTDEALEYFHSSLKTYYDIGHSRGKSYCYLRIGYMSLLKGEMDQAQQNFYEVLNLDFVENNNQANLALGIIALYRQKTEDADAYFSDACVQSRGLLTKTTRAYAPQYILSTALVGRAVCHSRWADLTHRTDLLALALAEYSYALDITSAPGIVRDALRDLELICAAGVEGLEPVFELLEGVLDEQS